MNHKLLKSLVLSSVSLLALPGLAAAQDNAQADTAAEDRGVIIVTAQGREQALNDVPVSVSVVSGEDLLSQNLLRMEDVAQRLGNVKITSTSLTSFVNIRGTGSGNNPGFEQSVATFSDGVYRSSAQSTRSALFDVDRVEVLKGPQTTFFGANAIAGALNISTRKPSFDLEYNASVLYGTDNEYSLEAGLTVPLTDTLAVRGAVRFNGMEGYIDTPYGLGPNEDSVMGRFSVRFEPSDNWRTDLRVDYNDSHTYNLQTWELVGCAPTAPFSLSTPNGPTSCANALAAGGVSEDDLDRHSDAGDSFGDFRFLEVALTNAFDVGPGTIRSITAYAHQNYDFKNSLIPVSAYAGPSAVLNGYEPLPTWNGQDYEFFSQELRFESETGNFVDYMFGGYYAEGELDLYSSTAFNFVPFGAIIDNILGGGTGVDASTNMTGFPQNHIDDRTWSVFAAATVNLSDVARLNLGARYSEVRKVGSRSFPVGTTVNGDPDTFVAFTNPAIGAVFCGIVGCSQAQFATPVINNDEFMPSASLQFDVSDDVMLYGSYAHGFKSGGHSGTANPSSFGPETVDAFEAGFKVVGLNGALNLNVAAFYENYKGLQESVFDANLQSKIENAASSVAQGIEIDASLDVNDYITLTGDFAVLDAHYQDYDSAGCTPLQVFTGACAANGGVQDLSGLERPYAPDYSGSIGVEVTLPVGDFVLSLHPVLAFSGGYFLEATADPYQRQDSYEMFDLRVGFGPEDGPWELAFIGKNLTNEMVMLTALGTPGSLGSYNVLPGRGASGAVQFTMRY